MKTQVIDGVPSVQPTDLASALKEARLVDVRRPDEYVGELGHVEGAELVTLGPDLEKWLAAGNRDQAIVFICRSGGRSGQATQASLAMGYKNVVNMVGGMLLWNKLGLPTAGKSS